MVPQLYHTYDLLNCQTEHCCICIPGRACVERFETCLRRPLGTPFFGGGGGVGGWGGSKVLCVLWLLCVYLNPRPSLRDEFFFVFVKDTP